MRLKLGDPRPPYQQIAGHLREMIRDRGLKPGDKLPTKRALAEQYGVSLMTAQHAFRVLHEEGLVGAWPGRGTYVMDPAEHAPPERHDTEIRVLAVADADTVGDQPHVWVTVPAWDARRAVPVPAKPFADAADCEPGDLPGRRFRAELPESGDLADDLDSSNPRPT